MKTPDHIPGDDLALFALQLLDENGASAILTHVQQCGLCREQVAQFQGDVAVYSLAGEVHTPPEGAQERLMRRIIGEPRTRAEAKAGPLVSPEGRASKVVMMPEAAGRRPRGVLVPFLGWAVAAAFALAAVLLFQQRQEWKEQFSIAESQLSAVQDNAASSRAVVSALTDQSALNVTLRQPSAQSAVPAPEGRAAYLPDRGALVFVASNMEPLKPYKVYELWLLPAKAGMAPVPAASFKPDTSGNATVVLPAGPKMIEVKGFGVTQEDDKSAPKQPTLPILLVGTSKS